MIRIFTESLVIGRFELTRGSSCPVTVTVNTKAWFSKPRQTFVVEHEYAISGGHGPPYPDQALRHALTGETDGMEGTTRHIKIVRTSALAVRLAVKSADDYGSALLERVTTAWAEIVRIEDEKERASQKRHEEWEKEREEREKDLPPFCVVCGYRHKPEDAHSADLTHLGMPPRWQR